MCGLPCDAPLGLKGLQLFETRDPTAQLLFPWTASQAKGQPDDRGDGVAGERWCYPAMYESKHKDGISD